jgi:hypothetical protein
MRAYETVRILESKVVILLDPSYEFSGEDDVSSSPAEITS